MVKNNHVVAGSIWIFFGVILLLKTLGVIAFSIFKILSYAWPLAIIAIGAALYFKKREYINPIISVLIIFVIFGVIDLVAFTDGESIPFSQEVTFDELNNKVKLELDFGVGSINLKDTNDTLFRNTGFASFEEPDLYVFNKDDTTLIRLARSDDGIILGKNIKEEWNIEIYDGVPLDIDMDYGVTDAYIDLRNLKVEKFTMESGVTDNEILFGKYPTEVIIESGVSDLYLIFKKDYPVRIKVNTGVSSSDFDGFTKKNGYYTHNYDEDTEEFIDVKIGGGVTDLNVKVE